MSLVFFIFGVSNHTAYTQANSLANFEIVGAKDERITIPFELINNLVVISLRINDSQDMKFILDTGVGTTLITGLSNNEALTINNTKTITLSGLGEGKPVEAFYSKDNTVFLDRIKGENLEVVILKKDIFHLSSFMGTFVHGLIGYDLFANFVVEINYQKKIIHLYDPEQFKEKFNTLDNHRLWNRFPLMIEDSKPYIYVSFKHKKSVQSLPLKLLIDSGSSNAFSFYELTDDHIKVPEKTISALIGIGLSGHVNGEIGRIHNVNMGNYELKKPVIAYPDSAAIHRALLLGGRNGSMGGDVLKRFKVIFHYQDSSLLVRSNSDLRTDFNYNMIGIEINTPVPDLPIYVVSNVREGSPAYLADVKEEDIITQIDGKASGLFTLDEILDYFDSKNGKYITLHLQRDSSEKKVGFKLVDKLKVDE